MPRTTRSRRGAPPRRRPQRRGAPQRRGVLRVPSASSGRSSVRRRRRTSRRGPVPVATQWKFGIGALIVIAAVYGAVAILGGGEPADAGITPKLHLVYTEPTANDAPIALPESVKADLREVGLRHGQIALTRVDQTGEVTTSTVDLTGRANDDPDGPVLKIKDRALESINTKIGTIELTMNSPRVGSAGHALFAGLTRTTFSGVPVTIVSSGLDLSAPVDFRALRWTVDPKEVVSTVRAARELPKLAGARVTFVVVPSAGAQEQLRQAQRAYRDKVWDALLTASGAGDVQFVDTYADSAASTEPGSSAPPSTPAPTIALPSLPDTPIQPTADPSDPKKKLCLVPGSTYFRFGNAVLVDPARTVRDLQPCISAALAARTAIELDGWASYEGPLTPNGKPSTDDPVNRRVSSDRVHAIAELLVTDMKVPRSRITRQYGHGNVDQPHPDPRDPANRVVIISYLTP